MSDANFVKQIQDMLPEGMTFYPEVVNNRDVFYLSLEIHDMRCFDAAQLFKFIDRKGAVEFEAVCMLDEVKEKVEKILRGHQVMEAK